MNFAFNRQKGGGAGVVNNGGRPPFIVMSAPAASAAAAHPTTTSHAMFLNAPTRDLPASSSDKMEMQGDGLFIRDAAIIQHVLEVFSGDDSGSKWTTTTDSAATDVEEWESKRKSLQDDLDKQTALNQQQSAVLDQYEKHIAEIELTVQTHKTHIQSLENTIRDLLGEQQRASTAAAADKKQWEPLRNHFDKQVELYKKTCEQQSLLIARYENNLKEQQEKNGAAGVVAAAAAATTNTPPKRRLRGGESIGRNRVSRAASTTGFLFTNGQMVMQPKASDLLTMPSIRKRVSATNSVCGGGGDDDTASVVSGISTGTSVVSMSAARTKYNNNNNSNNRSILASSSQSVASAATTITTTEKKKTATAPAAATTASVAAPAEKKKAAAAAAAAAGTTDDSFEVLKRNYTALKGTEKRTGMGVHLIHDIFKAKERIAASKRAKKEECKSELLD